MYGAGFHPFYQERYRSDPSFRSELNYTAERGIPHGFFLGGKDEWGPEDRAKVLAWYIEQVLTCSECGTQQAEWDPKQGGHLQAYDVKSWACNGCRLSQEVYSSTMKDNPDLHGIKVRLVPTRNHPYSAPRTAVGILGR